MIPRGTTVALQRRERTDLALELIATLDAGGLELVGVAWFLRHVEIAKADPVEAGRLAAAMYNHLAAYRPESPAPLDSGFAPTEIERDPRSKV